MQGMPYFFKQAVGVTTVMMLTAPGLAFSSSEAERPARWVDKGWALGVHSGRAVKQSLRNGDALLPYKWDFMDYYVTGIGLRKEMLQLWQHSRVFTEVNLSWISGDEDYAEMFLTPTISWDTFPWDDVVDTTFAIGVGLSYTTTSTRIDDAGQRWLASVIVELDMQPASWDSWSVFTRIHHRSNAYGLFGEETDDRGSNFPSLGVRYQF